MDTAYLENQFNLENKKNPIVSCVLYNIDSLDDFEKKIIELVMNIQGLLNAKFKTNYDLKNIAIGIIYLYNSYNILLDLPHMMDRIQRKGKPCSHLVYGELINQLSSITFLSESIKLINNVSDFGFNFTDSCYVKKNNLSILTSMNIKVDKAIFLNNSKKIIKKILENDLKVKQQELLICALNLTLNFYSIHISIDKRAVNRDKLRKYLIDNILK